MESGANGGANGVRSHLNDLSPTRSQILGIKFHESLDGMHLSVVDLEGFPDDQACAFTALP